MGFHAVIHRSILAGLLTALLCLIGTTAKPYWQSRGSAYNSNFPSGAVTCTPQCPGDLVTGAFSWSGLRCYNAAYAGNVADVYAPLDASHTLITCSAGGTLNETLQALATTCAVSCTVKTLYDQSGAGACSGACNYTQATIANRPAFISSCVGSLPCMRFVGASAQQLQTAALGAAKNQAYTASLVALRNGSPGFYSSPWGTAPASNEVMVGGTDGADSWRMNGGSNIFDETTPTDNADHAFQAVFNGASSDFVVDGTSNTGDAGARTLSGTMLIGADKFNNWTGDVFEVGLWNSAFSAGNRTGMNTNQHTYWGF